ncbi:hypothetical protein [Escherichia phage PMBT57]|uniref:Uncharacterized protein n=1 Tax=Escherichia phage PMBT57 TaxID=2079259 RepID=A0A2K9VA49_9CAUD|nr:hypothetical protein [Escherichia phage PMBT57]
MQTKDKKDLERLLRVYGDYALLAEITNIIEEDCRNGYANNPQAIIHRDAVVLREAVSKMQVLHPLRQRA